MRREVQWFATFLIACSLAVILEAQQSFVHGSDIGFAIRTDRMKYSMAEAIIIRYTVKNVSNGALFVPKSQWRMRCGEPPHLWARLEDKSGKHYEPGYAGSCLGPSAADRMSVSERIRADAVLVKPGQAVHGSFTFQPKVFGELNPGSYRLEAILYGWNPSLSTSESSEFDRMGAPFLIGEAHATTHLELKGAGSEQVPDVEWPRIRARSHSHTQIKFIEDRTSSN
jgi:hypothetical protein